VVGDAITHLMKTLDHISEIVSEVFGFLTSF
jgi:hypothetical protein